MQLNEYRVIPDNTLIYRGVDSAYFEKPLPSHLVGNNLGQIKL